MTIFLLAPYLKITMDIPPHRKIRGNHPPLTATFKYIQDATIHIVKIMLSGPCFLSGSFQKWSNFFKLCASNIAWVGFSHILLGYRMREILNRFLVITCIELNLSFLNLLGVPIDRALLPICANIVHQDPFFESDTQTRRRQDASLSVLPYTIEAFAKSYLPWKQLPIAFRIVAQFGAF